MSENQIDLTIQKFQLGQEVYVIRYENVMKITINNIFIEDGNVYYNENKSVTACYSFDNSVTFETEKEAIATKVQMILRKAVKEITKLYDPETK